MLALAVAGCPSKRREQGAPHQAYLAKIHQRLQTTLKTLPKEPRLLPCADPKLRDRFGLRARELPIANTHLIGPHEKAQDTGSPWGFPISSQLRPLVQFAELGDEARALDARVAWKRLLEQTPLLGLVRIDQRTAPRFENEKLQAGSLRGWLFVVDLAEEKPPLLCASPFQASGSESFAARRDQPPLAAAWADLRLNTQRALDDSLSQISKELTIAFD